MGNNPSQSTGFFKGGHKTVVLLDTAGNIRKLKLPVTSADIMIEEPGHVIAPVDELHRTRRIAALPADHELLRGKAYMLVPAGRVHSRASDFEIAITEPWDSEKRKTKRGWESRRKKGVRGNMAKVIPVASTEQGPSLVLKRERFGNQGRWSPALEPILESP
ncbi:uncharacterized protein LOC129290587 [Prosopis cineraria]|uniref:uncharacterized protein LOC129290587 n=1 Tax=Prosopis cineraria TaxID=364024 RepID=UPI00240FF40C|nr:uncharacterized protein LOC129290587 [Prosopis cineraria]